MEFEPLVCYEDMYEIVRDFPYPIRQIIDKYVVKELNNGNGYIHLNLNNGVKCYKHVLVVHFIPNEDPIHMKFVGHINQNQADYYIDNLIWSTQSTNFRNKPSNKGVDYDYIDIDDISNEVIDVLDYSRS